MITQSLTSNPPSAVCAGFLTKLGNYCTLLILDNATVYSRHQDPLSLGCHWALHSITVPLAENLYQDLSRGLKVKHMLKTIKNLAK